MVDRIRVDVGVPRAFVMMVARTIFPLQGGSRRYERGRSASASWARDEETNNTYPGSIAVRSWPDDRVRREKAASRHCAGEYSIVAR